MPIPDFGDHGALPSFTSSDPTAPSARSPFQATMLEVVERFCTSPDRARLLKGLNGYRKHLHSAGFVSGFQWVDGSFVENVEVLRKRSPSDIDLVTLYHRPLRYNGLHQRWVSDYEKHLRGRYFDSNRMKPIFGCDTYDIDLDTGPRALLRNSTYWSGLFSDMRGSGAKKGFIEIPLPINPMEFCAIDQAIGGKFNV